MSDPVFNALKRARELISDRSKWTQGVMARDADGKPVLPEDSSAACWCATGALRAVAPTSEVRLAALARLAVSSRVDDPATVNDRLGYTATLKMFDDAIAAEAVAQAGAA